MLLSTSLQLGLLAALAAVLAAGAELDAGALVLVNSQAVDYSDFPKTLEPYLVQFGVPYAVRDIARERLGAEVGNYGLVIIGHRGLDVPHRFLTPGDEQRLLSAVGSGTGLVSFDGLLADWGEDQAHALYHFAQEIFGLGFRGPEPASSITIGASSVWPRVSSVDHFITRLDFVPRMVALKRPMTVPGVVPGSRARALAFAGNAPLIVSADYGKGRAILWTSYEWSKPEVKGKLYGMDDLVWRSLVWAARKPFLLRGMPHYLALRVDDVSGFGLGSNRHLGWVTAANRYGLKPWIGVFIDDLREDPEAIQALARFTQQGLATASVHARTQERFFYLDEPLLRDELDANVAGHDWPADKIAANFAEAETFFAQHGIVKSKYVVPHYYQLATNDFEGLKRWGAEFFCTVLEPGRGYGAPILQAGPYLTGEPSRPSIATDPIYIADWFQVPGHPELDRQFFNFVEEIRDVTGYEWAPSHVLVAEAIRRGAVECRRGFDSLLPAVLFTHESDHIQYLRPEEWDEILKGVTAELKPYQPISVTLDFMAQYLRALRTSKLSKVRYNTDTQEGTVELEGAADVPTKFYVFEPSEENPLSVEQEAPPFQGRTTVRWHTTWRGK